ncbi:TRAP transporter permease [Natronorubrum daqingense]|uniref:TRAP transporter n=1 Tax=Natronorubrum daqingense TaxID=588898 RepID=A0A1N7EQY4_9EURY|nr:TRAP transporter permease [Natronorubrum daqingense]APX97780.1 TRAP transporter [Natronorubrum daqingense]SIR90449.1 TRAP transporter, 4TM/12TM fusion protein [Natronorubrum daqingense]
MSTNSNDGGIGEELTDIDESTITTGSHWSGTAPRPLEGKLKLTAVFLAVVVGAYHVITAGTGIPPALINRPIHLAFLGALVFLWYESHTGKPKDYIPWYDWALAFLTFPAILYVSWALTYDDLAARTGNPTGIDILFGFIGLILVFEMTRRMTGVILPILAGVFMVYAYTGPLWPMELAHPGYSYERIVSHLMLSTNGVYGIPLDVSATYVVLFIILGAFLEVTGIGDWFIDLAYSVTGRMSGGPAKTSVIASSFMGSLNGSAVANTATTGAFTIPLMDRTGFKPRYAAAVEAAASSGGQILPPIMGAGAFIMAAFTGISYAEIIIAAAVPAALYFGCILLSVHFRAKKQGLEGLPASQLPDARELVTNGIHYLLPIVVLVYMLLSGWTAMTAGFVAIVLTLLVAIPLSSVKRLGRATANGDFDTVGTIGYNAVHTIIRALDRGIRMTLIVATACATAGIVVGIVTLTGLGLVFSSLVATLSQGVLLIGLIITMIASIVMGMGLPTTAAYIVVASLGAPALIELGVDTLPAHMFIFYFAILSAITPPVMLAVFTASGISESNPWNVAIDAVGLAAVGFLVPFAFVYGNELLLIGGTGAVVLGVLSAGAGVVAISSSLEGFLLKRASRVERLILFASGILLLIPGVMTDGPAALGLALVLVRHYTSEDVDVSAPVGSD